MDVKDYCSTMKSELTSWKAKVYEIIAKVNNMPAGDRDKASFHVNEFHALIDDISRRIEILNAECPADWEPEKAIIEDKLSQLKSKWSQAWDQYGVAEY
jgi:hypothetical protein